MEDKHLYGLFGLFGFLAFLAFITYLMGRQQAATLTTAEIEKAREIIRRMS